MSSYAHSLDKNKTHCVICWLKVILIKRQVQKEIIGGIKKEPKTLRCAKIYSCGGIYWCDKDCPLQKERKLFNKKPMPTFKEQLKEDIKRNFYDSDEDLCPEDADLTSVLNFIDQKIKELLEEIVPKEEKVEPINYEPNPINNEIAYHEQTLRIGFNQAISEIRENIKKLGY